MSLPEPDNAETVMQMREKILRLSSPNPIQPHDATMPDNYDDLGL